MEEYAFYKETRLSELTYTWNANYIAKIDGSGKIAAVYEMYAGKSTVRTKDGFIEKPYDSSFFDDMCPNCGETQSSLYTEISPFWEASPWRELSGDEFDEVVRALTHRRRWWTFIVDKRHDDLLDRFKQYIIVRKNEVLPCTFDDEREAIKECDAINAAIAIYRASDGRIYSAHHRWAGMYSVRCRRWVFEIDQWKFEDEL